MGIMAWHILEQLLEQTAAHSTLLGKFWTTFFFVLRFLMVVSIADTIFGDDRDDFECNVETPGCENVYYNDYSPISLLSLWAFQILAVSLPAVIFMVYTAHKMEKIAQAKKLKTEEMEKKKKPIVVSIKGRVLNGPSDVHINPTLVKNMSNISNMSLLTENQLDDFISKKIPTSPNQEGKKKNKKRKQVNGSPEKIPLSPEHEAKKKKKMKVLALIPLH